MRAIKLIAFLFCNCLVWTSFNFAQNASVVADEPVYGEISGKVVDAATGQLLENVNIVVEGTLRVESDGLRLLTRSRGDCVGEIALIDNEPRSADAIADGAVRKPRRAS